MTEKSKSGIHAHVRVQPTNEGADLTLELTWSAPTVRTAAIFTQFVLERALELEHNLTRGEE